MVNYTEDLGVQSPSASVTVPSPVDLVLEPQGKLECWEFKFT